MVELLPTSNWEGAVGSEPIKKNTRQNEKPWKKRLNIYIYIYIYNKEEDKGERKLPGLAGMGAAGTAKTSTVGTTEADAKGMA